MKLRSTHTLISAYVALATIAVGLLAYSAASRLEPKEPMVGVLNIEPVTKAPANRIASRSASADPRMAIQ